MSQEFSRKVEDFTCEHCGAVVVGNGYTNHCPQCLWSKHVDVTPGDRAADCGYLMEPYVLELVGGEFELVHRCLKCGYQKRNKTSPDDDLTAHLRSML
jgi:rubrerythrin